MYKRVSAEAGGAKVRRGLDNNGKDLGGLDKSYSLDELNLKGDQMINTTFDKDWPAEHQTVADSITKVTRWLDNIGKDSSGIIDETY